MEKLRLRALGFAFAQSWWPVMIIALLVSAVLFQQWHYTHPSPPPLLQVGDQIPAAISLETARRQPAKIEWKADSRPTILYVFRPDCIWCARNLEAERTVAEQASGYRFIGLSTTADGLTEYLDRNHLTFPVFADPNARSAKLLKLSITPETIVISPDGIVQKVWLGAYLGENAKSVEKMFGVKLPAVLSN